jgi:hypothetical protein
MRSFIITELGLMLKAYAAASSYGTGVEVIQALKQGETVSFDETIADALIADGFVKEA